MSGSLLEKVSVNRILLYGGDEFFVILANTKKAIVKKVIKDLKQKIESIRDKLNHKVLQESNVLINIELLEISTKLDNYMSNIL